MRESFSEILAEARGASSDALQISAGNMRIDVRDVSFDNRQQCLEMTMETDFIMPHDIYKRMLEEISESLPFVRDLRCHTIYSGLRLEALEIIRQYLPYILDSMHEKGSLVRTIDTDCIRIEDGHIVSESDRR